MSSQIQILAVFAYIDDLLAAIRALKDSNFPIRTIHSPIPNHEISALLKETPSPVRFFVLAGGILGILSGFSLAAYTAWQWKFIVSGKPVVAPIPYVIVSFEFCILFSIFFNVLGLLILIKLPKKNLPALYDPRVTEDHFSVLVQCSEENRDELNNLLNQARVEEIHAAN